MNSSVMLHAIFCCRRSSTQSESSRESAEIEVTTDQVLYTDVCNVFSVYCVLMFVMVCGPVLSKPHDAN